MARPGELTQDEMRRIASAYRDERPVDEICRRFGIQPETLYKVLEWQGVKPRAAGRGRMPQICALCTPRMIEAGLEAMQKYGHLRTEAAVQRIWGAMAEAAPKQQRRPRRAPEQIEMGL